MDTPVPLCFLLNSAKTQDGFRRAIRFSDYQRQKDYCADVINVIASKLRALEEQTLQQVAHEINRVTKRGASSLNVDLKKDVLAKKIAVRLVSHTAVTDVVGSLVGLMHELDHGAADKMADIIDHVLPLNYS